MRKNIVVVVADPNAGVRAGLRVLLESAPGLAVAGEAKSGNEALALVAKHQPHVLVLESRMPDMRLSELIEALAPHKATRVLLLSPEVERQFGIGMPKVAGCISKQECVHVVKAVCAIANGQIFRNDVVRD